MGLHVGDRVERLRGRDDNRYGRITGRVREDYDAWYVTVGVGLTHCDNGRHLRALDRNGGQEINPQA